MNKLVATVATFGLMAAPAVAAPGPTLDVQKGQTVLGLGVLGLSLDRGLSDDISVGGFFSSNILLANLGVRNTVRLLGKPNELQVGLVTALGLYAPLLGATTVNLDVMPLLQVPIGDAITLRIRGGLTLATFTGWVGANKEVVPGSTTFTFMPQPDMLLAPLVLMQYAELAWKPTPRDEVTLGGQSFIGWRRSL